MKDSDTSHPPKSEQVPDILDRRNRFLSHLTHDIRSTISGLEGVLSILEVTNKDNACQSYINAAQSSGRRLAIILLNILETARIESGNMQVNQIPYRHVEIISALMETYKEAAQQKGLGFSVKVSEDLAEDQYGDPVLIQRILDNLLDNAVRYTDAGSVSLTIDILPGEKGLALLRYVVEDTGGGMPGELSECMFDPYMNNHDSAGAGSRLGLPLCSMIAGLLGGKLYYEPAGDKGSRFIFEVPSARRVVMTYSENSAVEGNNHTARVLVVEDDEINLNVMTGLLNRLGVDADTASSGDEAVSCCHQQYYDLIMIDCHMPVMDGYETTRQIRRLLNVQDDAPACTIVAMTGDDTPQARQRAIDSGMDDYFLKPVSISLLATILDKHLTRLD